MPHSQIWRWSSPLNIWTLYQPNVTQDEAQYFKAHLPIFKVTVIIFKDNVDSVIVLNEVHCTTNKKYTKFSYMYTTNVITQTWICFIQSALFLPAEHGAFFAFVVASCVGHDTN